MPRRTRVIGIIVAAGLIAGTALVAVVVHRMNAFRIAEVVPGAVYRSSQPGPDDLADVARGLGIRQVLNLRGHRAGEGWHVAELAACRDLGLAHEDVRVKNDDWVAQHEARRFVGLLESAPGPVLIHCKNGSDRSGWGAAVASLLAGASLGDGLAELSPAHGHLCTPASCPHHRFFAQYEDYLAANGLQHDAATFRRWIMESYCPEPYDASFDLDATPNGNTFAPSEPIAFTVTVTNRSREAWPLSPGPLGVRLGGRTLGPFPALPEDALDTFRTPNNPARDVARSGMEEGSIPAGAERTFELSFPAPEEPGHYVLQIDMVDEHVHWFSDLGGPGVLYEFEVAPVTPQEG